MLYSILYVWLIVFFVGARTNVCYLLKLFVKLLNLESLIGVRVKKKIGVISKSL